MTGGSYLVNYRYSTLGILNEMGIYLVGERFRNNFQDLSFSLFFPGENEKTSLRLWGTGGLSNEEVVVEENVWEVFDDSTSSKSDHKVGILGLTHLWTTGENSHLKTTVAVMGQRSQSTKWRNFSVGQPQVLRDENYQQAKVALANDAETAEAERKAKNAELQLEKERITSEARIEKSTREIDELWHRIRYLEEDAHNGR